MMTGHESRPEAASSFVLDIGPGVGALMVNAPVELEGSELEVLHRDGYRTHAIVRRWEADGSQRFIALYPELIPGDYAILCSGVPSHVRVEEGSVATAHLTADSF